MKLAMDTVVPLGFIGVAITVGLWMGALDASTKSNTSEISELKRSQKEYVETVEKIDRRLSRIEGALEISTSEKYRFKQ